MNLREAAAVLAKTTGYDNRTVGQTNVLAWHEALSDLDIGDALEAVAIHHRESADYLMPVHVRRIVDRIDRDRRRAIREAADAEQALALAASPIRDRSAEVRQLIADLRDALPPGDPDKLRRPEWLENDRRRAREARPDAQPNPHYRSPSDVEDRR
jgi:hypothetical protein